LSILGTPGYGMVFQTGNTFPSSGQADFYRRADDSVWYDSPNWGGFTFGAYTTLSRNKQATGNLSNPHLYGAGAKYVGPTLPIQLWVAYEAHKDMNGLGAISPAAANSAAGTTSSSDHGIQVGAGYTLGDIFIPFAI